ncbi:uncharacterized protein METZ01_LOCUS2712 [marine metagenome]|uniref:Uncharacterized protein n=1 Tax=marine metagenome TaxID=408172 RepID=A0A381N848_9ZZZZ
MGIIINNNNFVFPKSIRFNDALQTLSKITANIITDYNY